MADTAIIQKFYVFVQAKGGWDGIVNAADGNTRYGDNDGIVSKGELNSYLKDNYVDYDMYDFETIWANIDTIQTGKIEGTNLEDLGRIDEKEKDKINDKAKQYYVLVNGVIEILDASGIDFSQINKDSLVYEIVVKLSQDGLTEVPNNIDNYIVDAARLVIKNNWLKLYAQNNSSVNNIYTYDEHGNRCKYDLTKDEDLNPLIDKYLNDIGINDLKGDSIKNVNKKVKDIIEAYLNTAGCMWTQEYQDSGVPNDLQDEYQFNPNEKLNELQRARLYDACSKALKYNALMGNNNFKQFENYGSLLTQTANLYLKNQMAAWRNMSQQDFWEIYGNGNASPNPKDWHNLWKLSPSCQQSLQNVFYNSQECKNLRCLVAIGGDDMKQAVLDFDAPNPDGWYNWQTFVGDGDKTDPKNFMLMLANLCGLSAAGQDALDKLVNSPSFQEYLKRGYEDIMTHPEKYGNINLGTYTEIGMMNALMKYFKDNLTEILIACHYSDYEIAYILANDAKHTPDLQRWGYGYYTGDDVAKYVNDFIVFVEKSYGTYPEVVEALKGLKTAYSNGSVKNMSSTEINDLIQPVLRAIDAAEASKHAPKPPTGEDVPNIDNYNFTPGRLVTKDVWANNGSGWTGCRENATKILTEFLNNTINDIAAQLNLNEQQKAHLVRARDNTLNLYNAIFAKIKERYDTCVSDGRHDHFNIDSFEYTWTDKNGVEHTETATDGDYHYYKDGHSAEPLAETAMASGSGGNYGVYVLVEGRWLDDNRYYIGLDTQKVFDNFKKFLNS